MDLARFIDHTILKPEATFEDVKRICDEARQWRFYGVCVNPCYIEFVANSLLGTNVVPISVIGFPLGASTTQVKVFEAKEAIRNGAREIDMVMNIGALKSKRDEAVLSDIHAVVDACKPHPVKVIVETCLLTDEEKVRACELAKQGQAAFVKTSTGFSKSGATAHDIALMRQVVGPVMGVKASGGVRTKAEAIAMIEAGASRIGASSSVAIVSEGQDASR